MSRRPWPAHERKLWHFIFYVDPLYLICAAAVVIGGIIGAVRALMGAS